MFDLFQGLLNLYVHMYEGKLHANIGIFISFQIRGYFKQYLELQKPSTANTYTFFDHSKKLSKNTSLQKTLKNLCWKNKLSGS